MPNIVDTKIMRMYYRMNGCYRKGRIWPAKLIQLIIRILFSAEIPYTVFLGENVDLRHGGLGVVLHANSIVGKDTVIYQNVTIAGYTRNGIPGVPVIGENVTIGAGAVILGG